MTRILDKADLTHSETAYEYQGHHHDAGVSFMRESDRVGVRVAGRRNGGS